MPARRARSEVHTARDAAISTPFGLMAPLRNRTVGVSAAAHPATAQGPRASSLSESSAVASSAAATRADTIRMA